MANMTMKEEFEALKSNADQFFLITCGIFVLCKFFKTL